MRTLLVFALLCVFGFAKAQDSLRVQVHGVVLNASTEKPVLEALVEWYDQNGQRQAVNQTNSEGNYAMFVRTTGVVELRVKENGYKPFVQRFTLHPGECAKEFTIRLVPK